jgi:hypothetical protein
MLLPAHSLARWLKLVLACVALVALTPAQAEASAASVTGPVAQVEGGPAKAPAARSSIRIDRYSPPTAYSREDSRSTPVASRLGPMGLCELLFLLHRALLR